jgi:coenzyme F420-0:L-glutamate ligase/coenzyme F420-1:gamma-L-glutamate ligase
MGQRIEIIPVHGLGEIEAECDLAGEIAAALQREGLPLVDGDVVVVTQKVVSKAEGCLIPLATVQPSDRAVAWGEQWGKDPRVVEIVLQETSRIVRMERGVIVSETRHGFVCANAGVDSSNVDQDVVCVLPSDPDGSASRLRASLERSSEARLAVVITDTFGRAWREGQVNVAIGVSGMQPLRSFRGQYDPAGYELRVTELATADEVASAAELVMGKLDRVPVAVVRGLGEEMLGDGTARALVRPAEMDLFR